MTNIIQKMKHYIKDGVLKSFLEETIWIYQYAKNYWLAMVFYTVLGLFGTAVSLGSSIVSKDLVDIITGHQTGALVQTFCIMVGLGVGNIIMNQFTTYISSWISMKVDAEIKSDIFHKMLITDLESIATYHTGDLLVRWSSDVSNISNGILNWIPNLIIYIFRFISALAVVLYHDPSFALFALMGFPVSLLLSKTLMRRMRNNNMRSVAMGARMSGFNQEAFSNIQTIKAFSLTRFYTERLKELQKEYISMKLEFQRISIVTSIILGLVGLLVSYSCYGWGIYRVWSGSISYGTMTLFLSLAGTLTATLNALTSLVPSAIALTTSARRLMDIMEMPKEDDSLEEQVDDFYEAYGHEGISLEMKQLSYAYHSGTKVFEQASLEAHPHEIIALVGPSGEGKTTMLRLILALLHPQDGECRLYSGTGNTYQELPLCASSRKLFSYVPQGNTMFSGTIASNMRTVKPDATDEEIIEALTMACAWEFVQKLPDGIHSELKERGGGFSEGQAQRLSIARSLLRKSPLLLLDEATSALDVATERNVLKNIMKSNYPRTVIVTTHRPTVLNLCTRVYRIHNKSCELMTDEEIKEMIDSF